MSPTQLATPTEPKPLATPTEPKPLATPTEPKPLATPTEPKPLATPTEPKPPNPKSTEPNKETKKTPPGSKKEIKVKQEDPGLDQPLPEEGFIKNYTDNRGKRFGLKKVNFDMIGRTGMYLERYGMPVETKAAFDWIAYNRHDVKKKGKEFQKNMAVALSGVGINKQLLIRTIVYLKTHEQITPAEMDNVLKEIESLNKEVVSFSQVSNALKKHCETYKTKQIEQMV
uniref:DUF4806 domain-containing protein n=1 Tax=Caenorhabditis tropicalis TaxID=1561998 RepID=A0A1I7TIS6_9PELO